METVKIEGIATITEKGFSFDSGMPSNEPVLKKALRMHGTLKVKENASAEFLDNGRVYLPPEINYIAEGVDYKLKRTTRHYIIQMKVPVVESRSESQERIDGMVAEVMGEITLDRRELFC